MKRLAKEPLNLAGAMNRELVLRAQFIHAENRDDVLQILVALQHALHTSRNIVMLLANEFRRQRFRGGCERIHCRINSELGDGTLQARWSSPGGRKYLPAPDRSDRPQEHIPPGTK